MIIFGITVLLIALYLGLVVGAYKKFLINGISIKGESKLMIPFVPISLISKFIFLGIKELMNKNKEGYYYLQLATVKYPILVGLLIEVMLE